jgi:hypothetical protein
MNHIVSLFVEPTHCLKKENMIKKYCLLIASILALITAVSAQTARVQIIHNSPDPDVAVMDLYVNGALQTAGYSYHEATGFVTVDSDFSIGLAFPGSNGPQDVVLSYPFTLLANSTNIFVINGVTNPLYQPLQPLSVYHFDEAIEAATNPSGTAFNFFNGSTDVGTVDLLESELIQLTAFDDVGYGDFSEYLELFTADYELSVFNAAADFSYASYAAPFSAYGWAGEAITVVSSGFINQANNPGGQPLSLWAAPASGGMMTELPLNELNLIASVQFIHNAADVNIETLDVLVNGQLLVDDIQFRHATSFLHMPAAQPITVEVVSADGDPLGMPFSFDTQLVSGEEYLMVLSGQSSASDYSPYVPFHLMVLGDAKSSSGNANEVAMCLVHSATDAGIVDVNDITDGNESLFNDINYGEITAYGSFTTQEYAISLTNATGSFEVGSYLADFTAAGGEAFALVASGFLDPATNNNGADFGLWLADADGGAMTQLPGIPETPVFAQVQWIHGSSDQMLANIDVYVNGELAIASFSFAEATGFVEVQVNESVLVEIYPAGSVGLENLIFSQQFDFLENENFQAVLSGIMSETGYNPAPVANWLVLDAARIESTTQSTTDVRFVHVSTDAGALDINELATTVNVLATDLNFEEFTAYQGFDASENIGVEAVQAGGSFQFGQWLVPLQSLELAGEAVVIFASGFFNVANNSGGNAFQLYLVRNNGSVIPLGIFTGTNDLNGLEAIQVFPNPADDFIRMRLVDFMQAGMCELTITGLAGNVVHRQNFYGSSDELIDVSKLSEGVYALELASPQKRISTKLMVAH